MGVFGYGEDGLGLGVFGHSGKGWWLGVFGYGEEGLGVFGYGEDGLGLGVFRHSGMSWDWGSLGTVGWIGVFGHGGMGWDWGLWAQWDGLGLDEILEDIPNHNDPVVVAVVVGRWLDSAVLGVFSNLNL